MIRNFTIIALAALLLMTGCTTTERHVGYGTAIGTTLGAGLGAGIGAIIGNQVGHPGAGVAIGSGMGAGIGALVGGSTGYATGQAAEANEKADAALAIAQQTQYQQQQQQYTTVPAATIAPTAQQANNVYACPHCGKLVTINVKGQRVRCPYCNNDIIAQ